MEMRKPTRRDFLKLSASIGISGLLAPRTVLGQTGRADEGAQLIGVQLEPFVDALPLPAVLKPIRREKSTDHYQLALSELQQKLHRDLPPTTVWGFEGSMPGPTLAVQRGRAVTVEYQNKLPQRHRLRIDHTLHGAGADVPEVRSVTHLHGGHVEAASDGHPEAWITPGNSQNVQYPNNQPAATLFYHDHAMGITRLNLMMGLAGFYLVHDPEEEHLGLPSGKYDIPVVLQDRILDPTGQFAYPLSGDTDSPWVPEFFGTHVMVNGKIWPYFEVEPRRYRFRFLNGSNARIYRLSLSPAQWIKQIGSDGGLLPAPVQRDSVLISPGERADAIIDFRGREGNRILLANDAPSPYPSGGKLIPHIVMQFRVKQPLRASVDNSRVPDRLAEVARIEERTAGRTRRLTLEEVIGANGRTQRMLLAGKKFSDEATEDPVRGSVEVWELVNQTFDAHPIHLHNVHFQVLDRRRFDLNRGRRSGEIVFSGPARAVGPEESGWKDTVLCPPGEITRIIARFDGAPGRYVWHCHTLEHEDNEMMRPLVIRT